MCAKCAASFPEKFRAAPIATRSRFTSRTESPSRTSWLPGAYTNWPAKEIWGKKFRCFSRELWRFFGGANRIRAVRYRFGIAPALDSMFRPHSPQPLDERFMQPRFGRGRKRGGFRVAENLDGLLAGIDHDPAVLAFAEMLLNLRAEQRVESFVE